MTQELSVADENQGQDIRAISVAEWHRLAQEGVKLPIRIQINGVSMRPFIRKQRDWVTLVPLDSPARVGDIVLFIGRKAQDFYVLHRIWKRKEGAIQTLGDGCVNPDPWQPPERILGKAILIERGKLRINPSSFFWRGLALAWMKMLPYRKRIFYLWSLPEAAIRKVLRILQK